MKTQHTHELRFHNYRLDVNHSETLLAGTHGNCMDYLKEHADSNGYTVNGLLSNGGFSIVNLEEEKIQKIRMAAPEMLSELEYVKDYINCLSGNHQPIIDHLLQVITKATT